VRTVQQQRQRRKSIAKSWEFFSLTVTHSSLWLDDTYYYTTLVCNSSPFIYIYINVYLAVLHGYLLLYIHLLTASCHCYTALLLPPPLLLLLLKSCIKLSRPTSRRSVPSHTSPPLRGRFTDTSCSAWVYGGGQCNCIHMTRKRSVKCVCVCAYFIRNSDENI